MRGRTKRSKPAKRVPLRRELSAGGLIWRAVDGKVEVVLVRPAGRNAWVLPKGHVEPGESVIDAAAREASEESGLKVAVGPELGDVSYVYSWHDRPGAPLVRIFKRVHFFLMECRGGDPSAHDDEIDEVAWIRLEDALQRATHKSERDLISKAREMLGV